MTDQKRQQARDDARNRFLAACSLAGASTTAYRNVPAGDSRSPVWVDIARLGAPDASAVLILSCGLHGVEGFCGSTIFTDWLSEGRQRRLAPDTGMIFIHAILPEGVGAGGLAAPDARSDRNWSDNILNAAARRFARYARAKGLSGTGEPEAPAADTRPAWLIDIFQSIAQEACEHARDIGLIEFHTSLLPAGAVNVASCHKPDTAGDRRVRDWFGEESGTGDDGPAALDCFALGFGDRLREHTLTAAHADFGTYTTRSVLRLEARRTAAERRADIGGLFFPDSKAWRDMVRAEGARIIGLALDGLARR
ncbi:MAG: DUF2817 domain-containing protein [Alphaproteobacteria bacterium]